MLAQGITNARLVWNSYSFLLFHLESGGRREARRDRMYDGTRPPTPSRRARFGFRSSLPVFRAIHRRHDQSGRLEMGLLRWLRLAATRPRFVLPRRRLPARPDPPTSIPAAIMTRGLRLGPQQHRSEDSTHKKKSIPAARPARPGPAAGGDLTPRTARPGTLLCVPAAGA